MTVITVNKFSGVSPKTPIRYLGNEAAQIALNCPVWLGSLQSIRDTKAVSTTADPLTKSGDLKSIYRWGQDQTDEKKYWFHWAEDVDVVQGFINGDTTERTYYTGAGSTEETDYPKVTDNALALAGTTTDYPATFRRLGVPKPVTEPTTSVSGLATTTVKLLSATDTTSAVTLTSTGSTASTVSITGTVTGTFVEDTDGESTYGTYTVTTAGVWVYTVDPDNSAVNALSVGGTFLDSFLIVKTDDSTVEVEITITGVNANNIVAVSEYATVPGGTLIKGKSTTTLTNTLTTAVWDSTASTCTVDGTIDTSITEEVDCVDTTEPVPFVEVDELSTIYGTFSMDTQGNWGYLVDRDNTDVEALRTTEKLSELMDVVLDNDADTTEELKLVITGAPVGSTTSETRVYTFTYVNSWDEESAPYSDDDMSSSTENVYPGQDVVITFPSTPAFPNYDITKRRIYRSAAGSGGSSFFFVAEVLIAATDYTDSIEGDSLNEEIPSLAWEEPPEDLQGLVGLPNGVMAGFVGNDIYFSEPYRPFAWPLQYSQSVGYPIVGLGVIDTTVVVLTKGKPYFLQGQHPSGMIMIEADVNQACISKRSIVSLNNYVFYASPDGLVGLSPGGSNVVTQSLFDKYSWQNMNPAGLVGCRYENQYIGFLETTTGNGGFIYDITAKTWNFHDIYATGGFNDLKNDALYVIEDDELFKWDTGSVLDYIWKSKKFTFPEPKGFTCYRVQAEAYPVTIKIYRDGSEIVSKTITSGGIERLPSGLGTDWEFQLEGNKEVYNVQIAQSPMEFNQG